MSNRSLAETLVFVNLLFTSALSVRACSGVHDRVRVCFGTVRVMFGYRSGYVRALFGCRDFCHFGLCAKKQNTTSSIWLNWGVFDEVLGNLPHPGTQCFGLKDGSMIAKHHKPAREAFDGGG